MAPRTYRAGALGAMMDEYERAAADFAGLVGPLRQVAYVQARDADNPDPNCRTIQTVANHVVRAGYNYIHYFRTALGVPYERPDFTVETPVDAVHELETLASWMAATFEGKWEMPYEELSALKFEVRWGPTYDLEQLFEHAIVHLLRHRRQLERFLTEARFTGGRR